MNSTSSLCDCVNLSCLFLLFNILVLCIHDCILLSIVFDKILEYQYLNFQCRTITFYLSYVIVACMKVLYM